MKKIFLFSLVLAALSSCDKVNDPYCATAPTIDTTVTKVRKVLLEDYTGHKCGNCPPAAVTAQTIKSTYGDRLVIMSVHAGFYATPLAAPYTYDFRTVPGTDYDNFFGNGAAGNPNGMVNRIGYPTTTQVKSISTWGTLVDGLMAIAPDAYIKITNNYNSSTRVLNTTINTEFLNMMSGSYKLVVLLTEDSIVQPQLDYAQPTGQQNVLNYVHHHVLRAGISSTSWGDVIAPTGAAAGDTMVNTFTYTLPATFPATAGGIAPKEDDCYVVAYIYDVVTYEVIQVEEKKIK